MRDDDLALTGGEWVTVQGIRRWVKGATVIPKLSIHRELRLIACPVCRATLAEPCRTEAGGTTTHARRIIARRCTCGNPLRKGHQFCTGECREDARKRAEGLEEMRRLAKARRSNERPQLREEAA